MDPCQVAGHPTGQAHGRVLCMAHGQTRVSLQSPAEAHRPLVPPVHLSILYPTDPVSPVP